MCVQLNNLAVSREDWHASESQSQKATCVSPFKSGVQSTWIPRGRRQIGEWRQGARVGGWEGSCSQACFFLMTKVLWSEQQWRLLKSAQTKKQLHTSKGWILWPVRSISVTLLRTLVQILCVCDEAAEWEESEVTKSSSVFCDWKRAVTGRGRACDVQERERPTHACFSKTLTLGHCVFERELNTQG